MLETPGVLDSGSFGVVRKWQLGKSQTRSLVGDGVHGDNSIYFLRTTLDSISIATVGSVHGNNQVHEWPKTCVAGGGVVKSNRRGEVSSDQHVFRSLQGYPGFGFGGNGECPGPEIVQIPKITQQKNPADNRCGYAHQKSINMSNSRRQKEQVSLRQPTQKDN